MTDPATLATVDAQARERALDTGRSFIVQAPAGSGKTTVLTQRYLKLLAEVEQPEQVLAITFTRKAAGEMRERVQQALTGEVAVRSPADAVTRDLAAAARGNAQRRGWGIDESAARLRIQTIDAFNGYLANSLPITSRNGFGRGIADDPADLYLLAARETLRDAESDPARRGDLERILRRLDDHWARLERLVAGMLPRRAEWLTNLPQLSGEALVPRIEASLAAIVAEELARAAEAFTADFLLQAGALARFAAQNVDPGARPDLAAWRDAPGELGVAIADLPRWRGIATLALTGERTLRRQLTKKEGIPAGDARGKVLKDDWLERLRLIDQPQADALAAIIELPDPLIPADARDALDSLSRLLLHAAAMLRTLFDQHGECDHTEIAGAARQALTQDSSPTPLAERIGTHLRHILIDEFQDTSRDQYELLRTLTQDWSDGDGRTLFLVGDPMQSIYGFRNAEVGRFATVRAAGLNQLKLESLTLRRNFRSAPALVHWCNETFARVFPRADDLRRSAVPHLASVPGRDQLQGEARLYRVEDLGDGCSPEAEADAVAELIAQLQATRPAESIAVLASARPHLRGVRASLNARRIPFIGVNLEPLADVAVVRDLEALVRALESPLDRVAWLAVLRAPFVGLTLPDLTVVSEAAGEGTIASALLSNFPGLSPDGAQRLLRARPVLLGAWLERERENRAHLVERAWLALGGASACAHEGDLAQARRFLAALDEEDRKRLRGRPLDLDAVMGRLYAVDPAQPGAVSLMTIHGAKGLEFDHVFVVGVGRRGRGDEARLLNWLELPREDGPDHLLMAPVRVRGDEDEADDAVNAYLGLLHKERARAERTRLAYVALTRARLSLHVFAHPIARDSDGERLYRAGSNTLLDNLWPALGMDIASFTAVQGAAPAPAATLPPQTRQRLARQPPPPSPPPDVIARGELVPLEAEEEAIEFSWARQTARRIGTVVHETLERFGREPLPSLAQLPELRLRLQSRLEALGVEAERAREGAEVALRALAGTLSDSRGRWLFDPAHTEAGSELALSGIRGGEIVNVIIDRTFVDAGGTRWVVDFKTSPHEGGDRETFLDEEVKRYRAQLQRYAHLVRGLGPQPVRAGLYYPLLGAWREVPV